MPNKVGTQTPNACCASVDRYLGDWAYLGAWAGDSGETEAKRHPGNWRQRRFTARASLKLGHHVDVTIFEARWVVVVEAMASRSAGATHPIHEACQEHDKYR